MKWRDIPQIDAHIHIIPDEVHAANPDSDDEFSFAKVSSYQKIMDEFNIRRAIIMPFNDPWLMSMDFTVDAAHQNLLNICKEDGRFSCFSDVDIRNTPENTCDQIQKALVHSEFCGIKLHPNNSGMNIDDEYNDIIADLAVNTNYPIAVHSYPSSSREQDRNDYCARIVIVWLGGNALFWPDNREFNCMQDIAAARIVMNSGAPLVLLPCQGIVSAFTTTGPELEYWLRGKNPLCDYLADHTIEAAEEYAKGKVWSRVIWDVTTIGWLLNEDGRFMTDALFPTPIPEYDNHYAADSRRPFCKMVTKINRDALFQDLFTRLAR